ncbi:mitochondrial RNA-splicing protein MRS4 [Drosophila miranda]|uniref:mitochondrial RNA-splicing protein MRS4 n=1 Tax=Drosophila miranda TaxID=7229 RepID=UPI0007E7A324|nr:mitochondrial RNA-splicing protein MRS4 [Drosophila miranda]
MSSNDSGGTTLDRIANLPVYVGYVINVAAIMLSHPIDIIRVNIQANVLHYVSYSDVVHLMFKQKRIAGFYYGIRGALLRCTVQTGTTYALYHWLKDNEYLLMLEPYDTSTVAGISGLGGGLLSTPFAKVAIVRQADLTRRPFLQRNYRDPWKALKCMYGKGGMSFLFTGCELHAFTTGAVAALYAPVHDWVSDMLLKLHRIRDEDWVIDLMAMTITSSIISLILTPVEAVKTVVMNSCYKKFPSKTHLCLKIIQLHGYRGFFLGLRPALIAILPHAIIATLTYPLIADYFIS